MHYKRTHWKAGCFVIINSILLNLLCFQILFQNATVLLFQIFILEQKYKVEFSSRFLLHLESHKGPCTCSTPHSSRFLLTKAHVHVPPHTAQDGVYTQSHKGPYTYSTPSATQWRFCNISSIGPINDGPSLSFGQLPFISTPLTIR